MSSDNSNESLHEIVKDSSVMVCKICKEIRTRYLDKTYPAGAKRWVDVNGKMFNGKVCPNCHNSHVRQRKAARDAITK